MSHVAAQELNQETDARLLLLSELDNVFVLRQAIVAGESIMVCGEEVLISEHIGMGHKLARSKILVGHKVLKYGVSIGSAVCDIAIGAHVHIINLKSDYTPTHTLDAAKAGEERQ